MPTYRAKFATGMSPRSSSCAASGWSLTLGTLWSPPQGVPRFDPKPSLVPGRRSGKRSPRKDATDAVRPVANDASKKSLIKIGAKFVSHSSYVAFQMAEAAMPRIIFADILRLIAELRPPPVASTG